MTTRRPPPAAPLTLPPDRRAELVQAAYYLIAKRGLEGLRTRDIAERVGINIATLHYYFDTKERLLIGVVGYVTALFQSFHAPLPRRATPLAELRHLVLGQALRRRARSRVDVVMQELMLRARRDPPIRKALATLVDAWRGVMEDLLVRAKRAALIRKDVVPKPTAAILTAFLLGAHIQLGITPTGIPLAQTAKHLLAWLVVRRALPSRVQGPKSRGRGAPRRARA